MIRVLHVITRLDPGGSTENTLLTVEGLDRRRFQCELLYGRTAVLPAMAVALRDEVGLPLHEVPRLLRRVAPAQDFLALAHLWRYIRRGRFDLVHTHSSKAGFLGRVAARLAGVPRIVHTPHGHIFGGYFGLLATGLYIRLERWAARFTDRIITLSDQEQRDHLARGIGRPDQLVTIPSGVDLKALPRPGETHAAVRKAMGVAADAPLVGTVARLVPVKGLAYLLEGARRILESAPEVILLIVGDGDLRGELESRARALGVGGRIRFVGFREDAARWIAALDVFVLPSINEGMGRVLVQAMALEVPVVASRVGGVPEVTGDGDAGILVPPRDPAAIAEAVLRLLGDPALRGALGQRGAERAQAFRVERMIASLEDLYEALGGKA